MNRATKYLLLCAVMVVASFAFADWYLSRYPGDYDSLIVIAFLFFVPGRVSGHYLKDLYRSRRFLDSGRYPEAINSGRNLLGTLKSEPWRRKLIYLTWSVYTWNVEAMARNNIGASQMMLGDFESARHELNRATALDPSYALPYANLAAMAAAEGDQNESVRLAEIAKRNGYSESKTARLVDKVGAVYAKLQ